MIDRKTDRNCDTGGFELIYRQPTIASPPYIGLNLSLEGHAYTRSGVKMSSSSSSYQPPSAYVLATARSPSPGAASAAQPSQTAASTSSMASSSQSGVNAANGAGRYAQTERREKAGDRFDLVKRAYMDLPPGRIASVTANAAADEGTSGLPLNFLPVLRYRNARGGFPVSGPKKALPPVSSSDSRSTLRQSLTVRKLARSEEDGDGDGSSSGTRPAEEPLPHFVQLHKFQSMLRSKRVRSLLGTSSSSSSVGDAKAAVAAAAEESSRRLSTDEEASASLSLRKRPHPEAARRSSSVLEVQVSRLDPRLRVDHRPSSSVDRLPALEERERSSAHARTPKPPPPPSSAHRAPSASASEASAASRTSSAAVSRPLSAVTAALPEPVPMGLLRASRSHQSSASLAANAPPPDSL